MKKTPCFSPSVFSDFFTNGRSSERIAVYRGVIVFVTHDTRRLMGVLDTMPARVLDKLMAATADDGSVCFLWKSSPPSAYTSDKDCAVPDGDVWSIYISDSSQEIV